MRKILLLCIVIMFPAMLAAHPWKPSHYVIIDTDGGVDDMKAITLMLASPDIRVLGIVVSPGALSADEAYIKVKSLLNSFYHEGIEVGIYRNSWFRSPMFPAAYKTVWGNEQGLNPRVAPDGMKLIEKILSAGKAKVTFISLGGLSSAADGYTSLPQFRMMVKDIFWSSNGMRDSKGFNFSIDPSAVKKIMKADIPVKQIIGTETELFYDNDLLKSIEASGTIYSERLAAFFSSAQGATHDFSKFAVDEMTALYLQFPALFRADSAGNKYVCVAADMPSLKAGAVKMLKGETVPKNQVFRQMPEDPEFYFDDIKPFVREIIGKYGTDEWSSGVIANELHRHLGVFAIIGVKMGIRAREYFDTGVDEFHVTSFAGSEPPLSCMNDGLQVSTGATPGHGLLTVRTDTSLNASVEFNYLNHRIRLTLKPEIASMITGELKQINFVYGLDSNIYWELVRKNTIKYWRDLDRHSIFLIEVLQ
jgi:inosine-uridine nucleoside N-ribohydrolase